MTEDSKKNYRRHGSRYRARRRAADILYEAENRDVDPVELVAERIELARDRDNAVAPVAEYTRAIVSGVADELDTIDEKIERFLSADWELHRIPAVDRAILRVSTWELLFNPDIPTATAVVEGVELASEYSNDVAPPYVHAVLDDIAQSRSESSPLDVAGDADADEVADAGAEAEDTADSEAAGHAPQD